MFDLKALHKAIQQIAEEKNIEPDTIWEAVEESIAAAYKREHDKKGEIIRADFDHKTGDIKFFQVKTVVDETTVNMKPPTEEEIVEEMEAERVAEEARRKSGRREEVKPEIVEGIEVEVKLPRYNPDRHILIEEAKTIKKDAELGGEVTFPLETQSDFGRIAAQTAKQVILQKIREAERFSIIREFQGREGDIVSGVVQRYERGNIYVDLGRATGVMFSQESMPSERYHSGDRMRFFVMAVQDDMRTPGILLSRAHPKFVVKLFEMEVPEIADHTIEIKGIAREPGSRTKIAVQSNAPGVDPVGSCVGQRGTRVLAVTNELHNEKIDIVEFSEDPVTFIENALSPARIEKVEILENKEAKVAVLEDQLSLAIGRGGQNVRLAARLTGWKIDVRSASNPEMMQDGGAAGEGEETAEDLEK